MLIIIWVLFQLESSWLKRKIFDGRYYIYRFLDVEHSPGRLVTGHWWTDPTEFMEPNIFWTPVPALKYYGFDLPLILDSS